jgi:hypothetical protein
MMTDELMLLLRTAGQMSGAPMSRVFTSSIPSTWLRCLKRCNTCLSVLHRSGYLRYTACTHHARKPDCSMCGRTFTSSCPLCCRLLYPFFTMLVFHVISPRRLHQMDSLSLSLSLSNRVFQSGGLTIFKVLVGCCFCSLTQHGTSARQGYCSGVVTSFIALTRFPCNGNRGQPYLARAPE